LALGEFLVLQGRPFEGRILLEQALERHDFAASMLATVVDMELHLLQPAQLQKATTLLSKL
jgi:hypothetical protein